MGSELVRAAYAAFFFDDEKAALVDDPRVRRGANANERMVLLYMCSIALDDDTPPRYWGGRDSLARHALGRVVPQGDDEASKKARRSIHESVRQALEPLVTWGAIERLGGAYPGRQQEYAICVRELLQRLQMEQGELAPSASSPWPISKERLSKAQGPLGPETKQTNTKREHQDHPGRAPHLAPVERSDHAQTSVA